MVCFLYVDTFKYIDQVLTFNRLPLVGQTLYIYNACMIIYICNNEMRKNDNICENIWVCFVPDCYFYKVFIFTGLFSLSLNLSSQLLYKLSTFEITGWRIMSSLVNLTYSTPSGTPLRSRRDNRSLRPLEPSFARKSS